MPGEGISVGPMGKERGVGGLGSNNRVVKACCSDGIEEEVIREGKDVVVVVGTGVMVRAAG